MLSHAVCGIKGDDWYGGGLLGPAGCYARQPQQVDVVTPTPSYPATVVVHGQVYSCDEVRQAVSQGEDYTPEGQYIYAILLMDCDF